MHRYGLTVAALAAVMTATSAIAKDAPAPAYGPPPQWDRYTELAEAAVKSELVDPDSAKISWPHGYHKGGFKPFLSKRVYGYATCGFVNSRNRMGGYAGATPFVVVIDYDQVEYLEIARSSTDMVASACAQFVLPPVSDMPNKTNAADIAAVDDLGFELNDTPDGAYVARVSAGSAAAAAGLKPSMVITQVNGVNIGGLGLNVIRQLIARSEGETVLTTMFSGVIKVPKHASAAGN